MKNSFFAALIAGTFFFCSCGDNANSSQDKVSTSTDTSGMTGSSDTLGSRNNMSGDTGTNAMNSNTSSGPITDQAVTGFVQKALSGGMMEVELGNLASTKAQNQRVKNFAAMIVADHTAAGNELKQMASRNSITQPAMLPEHRGHLDMLKNKSGAAFDKAYIDMMVKDHKKDIEDYKKAANNLSAAEYKAFASRTLPVLQKHLDSAQAIHKNM